MNGDSRIDVGTAEDIMELAQQGRLAKQVLAGFLVAEKRQAYLDTCAAIEKRYTVACGSDGDPCLEGGCAVEGEICLQPLLRADEDYSRTCGEEFIRLFADPRNRTEAWRS